MPEHVVCDTTMSRTNAIDTLLSGRQHQGMNIWPQRERFKSLVLAYRHEHQIDRATMASMLNIKESHLHGLLYDKRVRPSLEVVQRAAEVFEVSITELVDDPGQAPPGVESNQWINISERDRVIASAMFSDITAKDLSEQEKDELYLAWRETVDRVRRLREKKDDGSKQP